MVLCFCVLGVNPVVLCYRSESYGVVSVLKSESHGIIFLCYRGESYGVLFQCDMCEFHGVMFLCYRSKPHGAVFLCDVC